MLFDSTNTILLTFIEQKTKKIKTNENILKILSSIGIDKINI